jgi:sec-independent protein translocase protein TatB
MFDMGFTELMLIGIVALVVIGPERLPGVARTAGKYVGRLKRFMTTVKADVEQELRADELRQILSEQQKELDSLKDTISEAGRDIEKDVGVDEAVEHSEAVVASVSAESSPDESRSAEPVSAEPAVAKPAAKKATAKKTAAKKPAIKKSVGKKSKSKSGT